MASHAIYAPAHPMHLPGIAAGYPSIASSMPPAQGSQVPTGIAQDAPLAPGRETKQLTDAQLEQQRKNLKPFTMTNARGWEFSLQVIQQPQRARMCGFGDKDRRPITPPPCVRLIVRDSHTGKEIDVNEIEHNMYILNVDLWSDDALQEVNLVRSTTATPSISSTTPVSYQSSLEQSTPASYPQIMPNRDPYAPTSYNGQPPSMPYGMPQQAYPPVQPPYVQSNGAPSYGPATQYYPQQDYRNDMGSMGHLASQNPGAGYAPNAFDPVGGYNHRISVSAGQPQGMFTRNLIGSLAASAFRLTDTDDKIGIWFVLQDLSVRTEGNFRLRFSFVDVGSGAGGANGQAVNHDKAPVLASSFSDVFQVFSAKKFPGVCESTALSKCFATQGIKIPIRKDNQKSGGDDGGDDY